MIAYSHHTVTPTPHYFPIPNSILIYYYRCSYICTHASLQSIYSKFKGRLATHFRSNSFATYDPRCNRNVYKWIKISNPFSRRRNPAQYWSRTSNHRRSAFAYILHNRALFFRLPVQSDRP